LTHVFEAVNVKLKIYWDLVTGLHDDWGK